MAAYGQALAKAHMMEDQEASHAAQQAAHKKYKPHFAQAPAKGAGKAVITAAIADSPYTAGKGPSS
jgi:hypothetical protein